MKPLTPYEREQPQRRKVRCSRIGKFVRFVLSKFKTGIMSADSEKALTSALDDIFPDVVAALIGNISINPYKGHERLWLTYENGGFEFECEYTVGGEWYNSGDGYAVPYDPRMKNGWAYVDSLSITRHDEDTDAYEGVTGKVLSCYAARLEDAIDTYMYHYK